MQSPTIWLLSISYQMQYPVRGLEFTITDAQQVESLNRIYHSTCSQ